MHDNLDNHSNTEDAMNEFAAKEENGIELDKEFYRFISSVDLSTPDKLQAFVDWRENDGTKAGIIKLIERNKL